MTYLPTVGRTGMRPRGMLHQPVSGTAAATPPAFTPTDIAGLTAAWDFSDTSTITQSGGLVSQVDGAYGTSYAITQATGSLQPTTGTRTINSLNVLDFASDSLVLASNPMSGATAGHVFYVMASDNDPGLGGGLSGAVLHNWGDYGSSNHEPYEDGNVYHGWGSNARKTVGDPAASLTTPRLIEIASASGAWSYALDGTTVYSTGTNTVGWRATADQNIGGPTGAIFFDGRIAEIVAYNAVLTGTDLTNLRDYLRAKWGTA